MARVREAVKNDKFEERIALAKRTPDMPPWWVPGSQHDAHLLKAILK